MSEYIERKALLKDISESVVFTVKGDSPSLEIRGANKVIDSIKSAPTADVVEVVRCKDCVHSIPLDKHCEINNSAYKHCGIHRGDDVRNVWHKYKKYYKHYSIVHLDDFCSEGERKEGAEE